MPGYVRSSRRVTEYRSSRRPGAMLLSWPSQHHINLRKTPSHTYPSHCSESRSIFWRGCYAAASTQWWPHSFLGNKPASVVVHPSYYIAPVGYRTHDLPHTVASNMVNMSHALTHLVTAAVLVHARQGFAREEHQTGEGHAPSMRNYSEVCCRKSESFAVEVDLHQGSV